MRKKVTLHLTMDRADAYLLLDLLILRAMRDRRRLKDRLLWTKGAVRLESLANIIRRELDRIEGKETKAA